MYKISHVLQVSFILWALLVRSVPHRDLWAAWLMWRVDSPIVWILLTAFSARPSVLHTFRTSAARARDRVRLRLNPFLQTFVGVWPDCRRDAISGCISSHHVNSHRFSTPVPANSFGVTKGVISFIILFVNGLSKDLRKKLSSSPTRFTISSAFLLGFSWKNFCLLLQWEGERGDAGEEFSVFVYMKIFLPDHQFWKCFSAYRVLSGRLKVAFHSLLAWVFPVRNQLLFSSLPRSRNPLFSLRCL